MSFRLMLALCALAGSCALILALSAAGAPPSQARQSVIVVLKDTETDPAAVASEHARQFDASVGYVYETALKGYAASVPEAQLAGIGRDSRVAYIERDGEVQAWATQTNATWGIDRIDQRSLPLSTTFTTTNTGAGVIAYVIDTGIRLSHGDFAGRAVDGYDAVDGSLPAADCNGHGTHVAGTLGGATYGVAKSVQLVAVRVLSCSGSGTTSGVIAGVDWVTKHHLAGQPAVANMSLGGGASTSLDTAVRNSIADGVSYAVAAGNGNAGGIAQNACRYSPARVAEALTIGASDTTDKKASWSNYGSCLDWFAPGVSITSSWYSSDTATKTLSGTSMATPHTAGVAALYLQSNQNASPSTLRNALYSLTTKGIVTSAKSANNHLLFTNF